MSQSRAFQFRRHRQQGRATGHYTHICPLLLPTRILKASFLQRRPNCFSVKFCTCLHCAQEDPARKVTIDHGQPSPGRLWPATPLGWSPMLTFVDRSRVAKRTKRDTKRHLALIGSRINDCFAVLPVCPGTRRKVLFWPPIQSGRLP